MSAKIPITMTYCPTVPRLRVRIHILLKWTYIDHIIPHWYNAASSWITHSGKNRDRMCPGGRQKYIRVQL
ncbi:hypothetical protein I7I48_11759 [Histoplasma ohiense]|nr:hypothetical protein I7I48_11759 [Histoplasma ohiense (nom. inval.)]